MFVYLELKAVLVEKFETHAHTHPNVLVSGVLTYGSKIGSDVVVTAAAAVFVNVVDAVATVATIKYIKSNSSAVVCVFVSHGISACLIRTDCTNKRREKC